MTTGNYYVYILMNTFHSVIYIGVTNDMARRIAEHKQKLIPGFTKKYNVDQLVCYEYFFQIEDAIHREKELKGWKRDKKIALILKNNPALIDLSADWVA